MKTGPKVGLILAAILLPCCGGLGAIGAFVDPPNTTERTGDSKPAAADQRATTSTPTAPVGSTPTVVASPTTATPSASATDQPVVEKRTVTETQEVAFKTRTVKDSSLAEGSTVRDTRPSWTSMDYSSRSADVSTEVQGALDLLDAEVVVSSC